MTSTSPQRLPDAVLRGYRELLKFDSVTCALSDCMGRFGGMTADMRPLFEGIRFAGPAVTARTLGQATWPPCSRRLMSAHRVTLSSSMRTGHATPPSGART